MQIAHLEMRQTKPGCGESGGVRSMLLSELLNPAKPEAILADEVIHSHLYLS